VSADTLHNALDIANERPIVLLPDSLRKLVQPLFVVDVQPGAAGSTYILGQLGPVIDA
jgi:hypothetical protein